MWKCLDCKKHFSVKVGTIMEDSAIGLDKWLCAFWLIANAKNGISSYEIHRALGITQKTAWFMLHRIRDAMREGKLEKLRAVVEADETFIGGKISNMHKDKRKAKGLKGRGTVGKAIVMGLLERGDNEKTSRIITTVLTNLERKTLHKEIQEKVKKGAFLFTDSFKSYRGLNKEYIHRFVDHTQQYVRGSVHTNGLENYWSLLKRTIRGTYTKVEPFHLFRYLDEQAFRFNERKKNDGERFQKVVSSCVDRRLTYKQLIGEV